MTSNPCFKTKLIIRSFRYGHAFSKSLATLILKLILAINILLFGFPEYLQKPSPFIICIITSHHKKNTHYHTQIYAFQTTLICLDEIFTFHIKRPLTALELHLIQDLKSCKEKSTL